MCSAAQWACDCSQERHRRLRARMRGTCPSITLFPAYLSPILEKREHGICHQPSVLQAFKRLGLDPELRWRPRARGPSFPFKRFKSCVQHFYSRSWCFSTSFEARGLSIEGWKRIYSESSSCRRLSCRRTQRPQPHTGLRHPLKVAFLRASTPSITMPRIRLSSSLFR